MSYTAKEVAEELQKEGYSDITTRTVNYYAFEKKMFDVPLTGKKCFTDREIEKIKAIKHLQKTTNFTLNQIKEIINTYDYGEIMARVSPVVYENVEDFYKSPDYASNLLSVTCGISVDAARQDFLCNANPVSRSFSGTAVSSSGGVLSLSAGSAESVCQQKRPVVINQDVTLLVSGRVDADTLSEMIESISNITKKIPKEKKG